ncbi:erythromycin esterase family protein [Streptomyces sp. p1417]|uniref:Erythromycin esterase family protein n=1 Tax=Streptomyces typhae TaxID=2681492 RepID=A0A6L6X8D9_9ACTN|nr:erythromycin esterase family protein [Streptomyces typhae]MVO89639.1 erythromycin esterase family protein [Streptomyces typhae]
MMRTTHLRASLLLAAAIGAGALTAPGSAQAAPGTARAAPRADDPVRAVESVAHPLRATGPGGSAKDLRPLDRMVGDAEVVGLGEATHGTHEFFTMKDRLFRHLVEEKGFRTFALEVSWTTGLRLDAYVRGGAGDVRELARQELARTPWHHEEYIRLLTWMRAYNERHPDRQVRFMGNDLDHPHLGAELFDAVTDHVRRHRPDLLGRVEALYAPIREVPDGDAYLALPLAERARLAKNARAAYDLVRTAGPDGHDPTYAWTLQHARSVLQTADIYAYDGSTPEGQRGSMLHRDRIMAENTAWWQRQTGHKVLVSAHNAHLAYESYDPRYPRMQGEFLRDSYGPKYRSIGFTFNEGSFMATAPDEEVYTPRTVGAAPRGTNEYTLDKVSYDDYYVDLRTVPRAARKWLAGKRPTRSIGTAYPDGPYGIRLGPSHDVLIHLHETTAAHRVEQRPRARSVNG